MFVFRIFELKNKLFSGQQTGDGHGPRPDLQAQEGAERSSLQPRGDGTDEPLQRSRSPCRDD